MFDIALLFDQVNDIGLVRRTYSRIAQQELAYRQLTDLSSKDILQDTFSTSILIGTRPGISNPEYVEFMYGIRKMTAFVSSGIFTLDTAILCAAKAAYLTALIRQEIDQITHFNKTQELSSWGISNPAFNKLNKLKKTIPEAFYYFYLALQSQNLL